MTGKPESTASAVPGQRTGDATVPWARQSAPQQPRSTSRVRRMVTSLPSWDPLPPGEILVQRSPRS
ncbi:hypothetical protein ACGFKZ_27255 [Micromonospora tulbaghiae]|uniref:hypothetical protein n=1 Tax=Micromonospora tulbaghiae TaxID=479978 RepID=UPI003403B5CC